VLAWLGFVFISVSALHMFFEQRRMNLCEVWRLIENIVQANIILFLLNSNAANAGSIVLVCGQNVNSNYFDSV